MKRHGFVSRISHDERGAILVFFVIALPAIVLMASFVIDAANWWEHKRHLQMQADAAALAGASRVSIPCDSTAVNDEVVKYSGIGGSTYNAQIGGTPPERLHMLVNSKTWPLQETPVDETVVVGDPCEAAMVDVKLTETDIPWFFGLAPSMGVVGAKFVNAHARATIVRVDSLGGALPVGVPDVNPKRGKVQFVDEDTGAVLGEAELSRVGTFNGYAKWEVPATSPISVTVGQGVKNIGMRVIMSGGSSLTCGDPLVDCYDAGSSGGLLYVRGWSDESAGAAPVAKSVGLRATTCPDAYFTYSATSCGTGLSADVDFGDSDPVQALGAKVTAVVGNKSYSTTYTDGRWELPASDLVPVETQAGPVPIELHWEQTEGTRGGQTCGSGGNNPCKGTFGMVQRPFAGSDLRSGPLRIAKIYESGLPLVDQSLRQCNAGEDASLCTYSLTAEIGLLGALQDAQTVDAPVVGLRVTGGSQNQSLDCDPSAPQLKTELANGCQETYTVNQGTACPTQVNTLWGSPQPWPCVAVQTGGAVGQVSAGMNMRVLGSEKPTACTAPNRWAQDYPTFDPADPRIVQVFLTPYGSFSGSGNTTVPVTNFATFYVTGWIGNGGFKNPCEGAGDEIDGPGEAGYIYGRFIKYIQTLASGGGNVRCDFESFGACTAVLTD